MKSLKRRIWILLAFSISATTLCTTASGVINANRILKKDIKDIMTLTCDLQFLTLDKNMESIEKAVQVLDSFARSQLLSNNELQYDSSFLFTFNKKFANFLENTAMNTETSMSVYIRFNPELTTPKTGVFYVKNENNTLTETEPTDISLYAPDDREHVAWWYEPLAAKQPIWISPYYNKNINSELISYIIPIFQDDTIIALQGMDLDFKKIKANIDNIKIYKTGGAVLLDKDFQTLSEGKLASLITQEFSETLAEQERKINEPDNNQAEDENILFTTVLPDKEEYVFSYKTLRNGMKLLFLIPKDEIFSSRNAFILESILIFLFWLILSICLSQKITNNLTKSIVKLTHCAEEFSKGNYDISVSLDEKDEMNILAKTFTEAAKKISKSTKTINELAFFDSLTRIHNRHYLNQLLDKWPLEEEYVGVIFCDLNKLKFTNDNYGHDAGDILICSFANMITTLFPSNEIIRYGGDEFLIIAKNIAQDKFNLMVWELDKANRADTVPTASIGSLWQKKCSDLQGMINKAENKMYLDKNKFYTAYPEFKR